MLRLSDLKKSFGGREAVRGLTIELRQGEVFGLLGPNGAGKSTTISMAVGLLKPDAGVVELHTSSGTKDPTSSEGRACMGVAPQSLAIYEDMSAEENLRFFGKLYGLSGADLRSRVDAVLHAIGLTDRRRGATAHFSGGMKRRLNLGIALIHDPPLLLMDEPTVGVDPQSRNAIFDLLLSLKHAGRTILYTTHYMEEAQRLCDRVGIIDHGRLLALDTVAGLLRDHGGHSILFYEDDKGEHQLSTDDPLRDLAPLLQRGDARGVRIERPNLETVFLRLTGRSLRDELST